MRKAVLLVLVLCVPSLFAQDPAEEEWRNRRAPNPWQNMPRVNAFEVTPTLGFTWGGTIFADQTAVIREDVEVEPSPNFGITLGIPLGETPLKLELLAMKQWSELQSAGDLFEPDKAVADMDVTYYHVGMQFPFAVSPHLVPFGVFSVGLADLDPQVSGLTSEQRFSFSFGGGVKVPMNKNLSLRFEGRGYYANLEGDDDDYYCDYCDYYYDEGFWQGQVNAGLVFSF